LLNVIEFVYLYTNKQTQYTMKNLIDTLKTGFAEDVKLLGITEIFFDEDDVLCMTSDYIVDYDLAHEMGTFVKQ